MGHPELEISGDDEGDPIWKPSNTNETGGQRRSETAENTKLSITRSFFELKTPDFAEKFVWTNIKQDQGSKAPSKDHPNSSFMTRLNYIRVEDLKGLCVA